MSKLGVHVSAGNRRGFGEFLQACADAGSPVPVVFSVDQDVWPDVQQFSPQTIVIFRHQNTDPATGGQDGPGDAYVGDPVKSAQRWMAANMPTWRKNRAHYYAPINEQDAGTLPGYTWLNAFSLECLRIADESGFKLALYGFSGGNPRDGVTDLDRSTLEDKWTELIPSLRYAKQHGHILLLHEYGFGSVAANGGPATSLRASAPHLALRYRRSYRFLHRFNADPMLVISEAGAGVGGFEGLGQSAWLEDAQWYDRELMRDRVVLGCCLYQVGGAENIKDALPALGTYVAATPTIAPEGDPVVGDGAPPIDPPPTGQRGKPRLDYARVVYTPDGGTRDQRQAVFVQMLFDGVGEYSQSFDSAMIGDLSSRTVHVFGAGAARQAAIAEWRDTFYPGVQVVFKPWPGEELEPFWISPAITDIPFRITDPLDAPRTYANRKHEGTDFDAFDDAARRAVAVYAVQDGVIDQIDSIYPAGKNYGRHVIVKHTWGDAVYRSWYCHLGEIDAALQVGLPIKRGEPIGVAGATGTTAIHLHLSIQHLNHGLSGYFIPDVIDPMSIMRVPTATPPTPGSGTAWRGLHMRADGHSGPLDFECLKVGKLNAAKIMTNTGFEELAALIERGLNPTHIVLRLFADFRNRTVTPIEFVEWQRLWLAEFVRVGGRYIEIHNEPNLADEGLGRSWQNAAGFAGWYSSVVSLIRANWPTLLCGYPGLSPSGGWIDPRGAVELWTATLPALVGMQAVDWIGVHCYWQDRGQMVSLDHGRFYEQFLSLGRLLIITEFSNNSAEVSFSEKGAQYRDYYASLPARVLGAFAFVSSASELAFNARRECWVTNGVITPIAVEVGK